MERLIELEIEVTESNVMADLEDSGFLQQPHTSAGRVPTDRGYRVFINHLMKSRALSLRERETIEKEVGAVSEIDQVLHQAGADGQSDDDDDQRDGLPHAGAGDPRPVVLSQQQQ